MTEWKPIATCPEHVEVLLWQPECKERYRDECMIIGSITRWNDIRDTPNMITVSPAAVDGYEWECDLTEPTMWAERPEAPKEGSK